MTSPGASGSKIQVMWEPPGQPVSGAEDAELSSGSLRIVWRKQSIAVMALFSIFLVALNAFAYWALWFNPMSGSLRTAPNVPGWFLVFWIGVDIALGSFLLYVLFQRTYFHVDRENLVVARRLTWAKGCTIPVTAIERLDLRARPIRVQTGHVTTTQTVWDVVAELQGGETILLEGFVDDSREGNYIVEHLRRALAELVPQTTTTFAASWGLRAVRRGG